MKKLVLFLAFIMAAFCGYAQDTLRIESKEQAIEILKSSEFMNILLGTTRSDSAKVDLLLVELNKIVPIDQQKYERLRERLLSTLMNLKPWFRLVIYFTSDRRDPAYPPVIDEIIKLNFARSDYWKIREQLPVNRDNATAAYEYLVNLYNTEQDKSYPPGASATFREICKYFDI